MFARLLRPLSDSISFVQTQEECDLGKLRVYSSTLISYKQFEQKYTVFATDIIPSSVNITVRVCMVNKDWMS